MEVTSNKARGFANEQGDGRFRKQALVSVSRANVVREVTGAFLALALITWGVTHAEVPLFSEYGHLVLSAAFIGTALTLARRDFRAGPELTQKDPSIRTSGARRFGIDLCGVLEASEDEPPGLHGVADTIRRALPRLGSELSVALAVAALVFPAFWAGFLAWYRPTHPFTLQLPRDPLDFTLSQVLIVALPEEALFRGYFQTRLTDLFPAQHRVLGASLSLPAWVLQAALFGVLHVVAALDPTRLTVFFPALLFGWLRAYRGGIGAAIWFHAACNLLSEILTRGYL